MPRNRAGTCPARGVQRLERGLSSPAAMEAAAHTCPPAGCFEPGALVAGRYRVGRVIANGASSEVFEALDERELNQVALKVVRPPVDDTAPALEAFELEAAAYARIDSPHVPKLYGIGTLENRCRFLVLELVRGRPLSERLASGPPSLAAVLELGCQLLSALQAVHSAELVHCDVKPQNLLVEGCSTGVHVRLVDFGISVALRKGSVARWRPAYTVVGTPEYLSPEQARGEKVDPRTDLYAAGVVLYQALTGRLPFVGKTDRELVLSKLRDPVVPPRVLRGNCPVELERLVMRALSRRRRDRYATARGMLEELMRIRTRHRPCEGWTHSTSVFPQARSTPQAITRPMSGFRRGAEPG